jgi:drug/metabolite transporter (DMT)-like permease
MNILGRAFLFAFIAAVGNAVFVYGQKKSIHTANPFIFLAFALSLCTILLVIASSFFQVPDIKNYLQQSWKAIAITSVGLFITYFGFYLLYSRFGASYYIIYAVTSIVTTSIIVGIIIFKETFNLYYVLSAIAAIATIVLFFMGQKLGGN